MRGKPTTTVALMATLLCLGATFTKAHERCKPGDDVGARSPQAVTVTIQSTDASCYGSNNGSATAIADGTAPYAYAWSNGKTTQSINNLLAGTYSVTVIDADGSMDSATVDVDQPDAMVVYANCIHTCPGECEGIADLVVSGGTPPYSYDWTGPNGFSESTEDLDELCAGLYWVTITDANGCEKIRGTVVSEVAGPGCEPTDTICDLSMTVVATDDSNCSDSICNGLVELDVSGGAAPYDIVWSNLQVGSIIDELCAGTYGFTVTDLNGCTANGLVEVDCEPFVPCEMSVTVQTTSYPCISTACLGTASAIVVGGVGPYTYDWSNGAATADIGALCVGVYAVTVTDENGCTAVDEGEVTCVVDTCFGFNATAMPSSDSDCADSLCNGAIALGIDGGTSPYDVLWSNGAAGGELSGLCPDTYSYTVTDANGCTIIGLVEVGCDTVVDPCLTFSVEAVSTPDTDCNDSICNGFITLIASGGTAPYSYDWDFGGSDATLEGLCVDTYGYTVVDANGCVIEGIMSVDCDIVEPCIITTFGNTVPDVGCGDEICTGSVYANTNAGTPPYTYVWSNGATSYSIGGLCEGVYSYTVTDATGCTVADTTEVTCIAAAPCTIPIDVTVTDDSNCDDSFCNGLVELSFPPDNIPFVFLWSNGGTGNLIGSVCAGVYTLTVTDAIGCLYLDTIEVGCDTVVVDPCETFSVLSSSVPDVDCSDLQCFGEASLAVEGTAPFTYAWSTGDTTSGVGGLCAGIYGYTVTDAAGCSFADAVLVSCEEDPCPDFTATVATTADTDCNDTICNGTATVISDADLSAYTFIWINGDSGVTATALCAGDFNWVIVMDSAGCGAELFFEITCDSVIDPCADVTFTATEIATSDSSCGDLVCDGSVQLVDIVGGTAPYSAVWENGAIGLTAEGLCGGFYMYTITDANGCAGTSTAFVNCNLTEDSCFGFAVTVQNFADSDCADSICDGAIIAMTTGGVGPFTYAWSNGADTELIEGLCVGQYNVVVTDSLGCTATASADISCVVECAMYVSNSLDHDSICNDGICDGNILTEVFNGTAPYSYAWSNGSTEENLLNICAGTYSFTVTDADGCTYSSEFIVIDCEPGLPCTMIVGAGSVPDSNCGDTICNGSAYIGTLNYWTSPTYLWSNGSTEEFIDSICAGVYSYTVSDGVCTVFDSITVTCTAEECAGFTVQGSAAPDTCYTPACEGWATLYYNNGIAPYNIAWSNGDEGLIADSLCSGAYSVTVTDSVGCTTSNFVWVYCVDPTCFISLGAQYSDDALCDDTLCQGGIVINDIFGGTPPYNYYWSDGSTESSLHNLCSGFYSVTVIDAAGCVGPMENFPINCTGIPFCQLGAVVGGQPDENCDDGICNGSLYISDVGGHGPVTYLWSNGETTQEITGLCAGMYYYTVTDSTGCTYSDSAEAWCLPPCYYMSVDEVVTPASDCDQSCDGSVELQPWGIPPHEIIWSNGVTDVSLSNLCAGVYGYTVTDSAGCSTIDTVTVGCLPPCALVIEGTVVNDGSCDDAVCEGSISTTVTGGVGPYAYEWNVGGSGPHLLNQCQGIFIVTVTDANGCSAESEFFEISCTIGPDSCTLQVNATSQQDSDCTDGICDGLAELEIVGGTLPVNYSWSNGETTAGQTGLCIGLYFYTVTDAAGCTVVSSVDITCASPCTTEVILETSGALCDGSSVQVFIAGDGGPIATYSDYLWSNGSTDAFIEVMDSGTYCVTVHTVNGGCEGSGCITVEPVVFEAFIIPMDESCAGLCNGVADVVVNGTEPYTYAWDNGELSSGIQNLCPGVYCVTVSDANQCTVEACALIMGPDSIQVSVATQNDNNCDDIFCTGSATASIQGGVPPYSYFWSNGEDTETIDSVCASLDQMLLVLDANGCFVETTFDIFCIGIIDISENDGNNVTYDMQSPSSVNVFPNPFNESATIEFTVPNDERVTLQLFDVTGRLIATLYDDIAKANQRQTVTFNGAVGDGLFVYRLTTADETFTGNIVQMK